MTTCWVPGTRGRNRKFRIEVGSWKSFSALCIAECLFDKLYKRSHSLLLFVKLFSFSISFEHPHSICIALLRCPLVYVIIKSTSSATPSPTSTSKASSSTSAPTRLVCFVRLDGGCIDAL